MKQGSILAFLRPKLDTKELDTIRVKITETKPQPDQDNEKSADATPSNPGTPRAENVQIKILNDPRALIVSFSASHIERLKIVTTTLFPVKYSDKFFKECLEPEKSFAVAFVATYDAKPVGWIRCRYEPFPNKDNEAYQQLYIQIIGVLAPFRGLGLAKALLDMATDHAKRSSFDVRSVYAHVWERNEDALSWYQRQGFRQIMLQPRYYRKLQPAGAWIVRYEAT